jgi:hypothetical protein
MRTFMSLPSEVQAIVFSCVDLYALFGLICSCTSLFNTTNTDEFRINYYNNLFVNPEIKIVNTYKEKVNIFVKPSDYGMHKALGEYYTWKSRIANVNKLNMTTDRLKGLIEYRKKAASVSGTKFLNSL